MEDCTGGYEGMEEYRGNDGRQKISRKFKGKVLVPCVTLAYLYGVETVALPERQ